MAVRKIIQIGHPALKAKNKKVDNTTHPEIKKLIKDLKDTMYKTGLVGIAAPQIGENYTVFLTHPRNTSSRKLPREDICRVYFNPRITKNSAEESVIYEGCGSVVDGEIFGSVMRPKEITINAINENGKKFTLVCDGLLARVIQHEMDHINGVEFIQKVNNYSKMLDKKFYKKDVRNSEAQKEASIITKIEIKE